MLEGISLKHKVIAGVIIVFTFIMGITCLEKVDAGFAGVVYNMSGGVEDKALSQGWHIVSPFKKVIEYPVSTETVYLSRDKKEGSKDDESFNISTKDGKMVNVDIAYSYRMDFDKLPKIFTKFRGRKADDIADGYVRDRLKESCNVISTTMNVQDVYGEKRQELNDKVYKRFSNQLKDVGILIETFSFTRIEPDENSLKAIQAKVDAMQIAERMKIEKEQAEIQAEKKTIDAQGVKNAKIIEAEGIAESNLIEAKAQAEANRMLNESLSDKVIQYEFIKEWDKKLPQVMGSNDLMINLK